MVYREPASRVVGQQAVGRRRTTRSGAVVAGLCGIAAAVALGVYVARIGIDVTEFSPGSVPSELWTLLGVRGVAAVLLLLPAAVAFGRGVVATWVLAVVAVLNVGLLLLEPGLIFGNEFGIYFDLLLSLDYEYAPELLTGTALAALTAGLAVLAASTARTDLRER